VQNPRTDIVNEFIDFPDDNETELQSLLNQLSTESVTVQEYVNLENSVQFNDTLTVEDIVQTIQEPSEDECPKIKNNLISLLQKLFVR